MSVRRALLYMPGDSMRKIRKAAAMEVDTIVMDLEDGVALGEKARARATVLEALQTLDFGYSEKLVRVNAVGSGHTATDVIETIRGTPHGYVLPKVESADDVAYLDRLLYDLEIHHNLPAGEITLQAIIESAQGLLAVQEIAGSSDRLTALQLGAEDLAASIGATRTPGEMEVFYARSMVVLGAVAHGLQAIDGVYLELADSDGCYEAARRAAELGFDGKLAIHPSQVEPIHRAFTPDEQAIANALKIVQAAEHHQASGTGAFELDGKMVDQPIVTAAERVLARARAAGKLQ